MLRRAAGAAISRKIASIRPSMRPSKGRRGGCGVGVGGRGEPATAATLARRWMATSKTAKPPPTCASAFEDGASPNGGVGAVSGRMRTAAVLAGSAFALWAVAPESKSEAASCSSSSPPSAMASSSKSDEQAMLREPAAASKASQNVDDTGKKASTTPLTPQEQEQISLDEELRQLEEEEEEDEIAPLDPSTLSSVALVVSSSYTGNRPIEDRHDVRQSPRGDFFASVFDGHGGWQAAELARKRLNLTAQRELKHAYADNVGQVEGALVQAFLRVEREYLYQVKTAFELGFGAVARTGACAIMALVRDGRLFVANAGDCRAVLGRRRPRGWVDVRGLEGTTEAVPLSNDHNAREVMEQEKLRQLHPFERDVFMCRRASSCYVKGRLQPTRSLGDAYLKYPEFNGQEGTHKSAGRFMPPPYTPPYITAEPEIFVHNIDPKQDDFVILASDGLWDHVSNAEAVDIIRAAAYEDGRPESAGERLVTCVLERAARNNGLSLEELRQVPEGPNRRNIHDDITCVVFFLKGERNAHGVEPAEERTVENAVEEKANEASPAQ